MNPLTGLSVLERDILLAELLPVLNVRIDILENRFDHFFSPAGSFATGPGTNDSYSKEGVIKQFTHLPYSDLFEKELTFRRVFRTPMDEYPRSSPQP